MLFKLWRKSCVINFWWQAFVNYWQQNDYLIVQLIMSWFYLQYCLLFFPAAMTLQNSILNIDDPSLRCVSELGSMLFTRGVSGTRVITGREEKIFNYDHVFKGGSFSVITTTFCTVITSCNFVCIILWNFDLTHTNSLE